MITLLIPASSYGILKVGIHLIFEHSRLFQPELFASRLFPSLGHLLVISVAGLVLVALYYVYGTGLKIRFRLPGQGMAVLLFVLATLLFLMIEQLLRILVLDSGISFEAHHVTSFSGYTVVGLVIIITWFIALGLVFDRAIVHLRSHPVRVLLYGGGIIPVSCCW